MRAAHSIRWLPFFGVAVAVHVSLVVPSIGALPPAREVEIRPDFQLKVVCYVMDEVYLPPEVIRCGWRTVISEAAQRLLPQIEDEIRSAGRGHPWAGDYASGPHDHLALSPNGANWFERSPAVTQGLFPYVSGMLELKIEGEGSLFFVPVHWGERHYLVPSRGWKEFQDAVASGEEPRTTLEGRFLLREGDERLPVEGQPQIVQR